MDRRFFLQLAAAPMLAGFEEIPSYKVVSHYPAAKNSEMPGPYRGIVARVHSKSVIHHERVDQASAATFDDRPPSDVRRHRQEEPERRRHRRGEREHRVRAGARDQRLALGRREPLCQMRRRR